MPKKLAAEQLKNMSKIEVGVLAESFLLVIVCFSFNMCYILKSSHHTSSKVFAITGAILSVVWIFTTVMNGRMFNRIKKDLQEKVSS